VTYAVDRSSWEVPAIFGRIQELGDVSDGEMEKVFNLGLGMVVVVKPEDGDRTIDLLKAAGHDARAIGEVVPA
jgi:phosphoribosylformylglycinamidine cyclo-ligase